MVEAAAVYEMRVMGPNGHRSDEHHYVNTTSSGEWPRGHIAFISQSGALCGASLTGPIGRASFQPPAERGERGRWSTRRPAPLTWRADEESRVMALYLEDVKGGPAFVRGACGAAAARKPVLALKTGRTPAARRPLQNRHTGRLAGGARRLPRPCKQTGVIEGRGRGPLQRRAGAEPAAAPPGDRIAIVTNSRRPRGARRRPAG